MKKILIIVLVLVVMLGSFVGYKWYTHYTLSNELLLYSSKDSPEAKSKLSKLELNTAFKPDSTETVHFSNTLFQIPKGDDKKISFANLNNRFIDQIYNGYLVIGGEKIALSEGTLQWLRNNKIDTEYELLKFVYGGDFADIKFFSSNNALQIQYELLALKIAFLLTGGEQYIGNFEDTSVKGFQACKPMADSCTTTLVQLFANRGNESIIIYLRGFNQEEINYIIKSALVGDRL